MFRHISVKHNMSRHSVLLGFVKVQRQSCIIITWPLCYGKPCNYFAHRRYVKSLSCFALGWCSGDAFRGIAFWGRSRNKPEMKGTQCERYAENRIKITNTTIMHTPIIVSSLESVMRDTEHCDDAKVLTLWWWLRNSVEPRLQNTTVCSNFK